MFIRFYQDIICDWGYRTFGSMILDRRDRALRVVEEAVELAQSEQLTVAQIKAVVDSVLARKRGDPWQEIGGVLVTTLAYAGAAGMNTDERLAAEVREVLAKPAERFHRRAQEKIAAGLCTSEAAVRFQEHMDKLSNPNR